MDDRTVVKNRSINLVLTAISGTAGIAAIFLPFTYGYSPMVAIIFSLKDLFKVPTFFIIAATFFLPILISAAYARWLFTGALSRLERALAYTVSTIMVVGLLYLDFHLLIETETRNLFEPVWWLLIPTFWLVLFGCVYFVLKNLKNKDSNAVMAMQFVFLLNFYFCFVLFFNDLEIGAYCAVVTSTVYLIQITQPSLR